MNERMNIPAELYPLKFINLSLSKLILSELIAELMIVRIISEHKDHSVFLDKYSHPSVKQSGVLFVCLSNSLGCCLFVCRTVWGAVCESVKQSGVLSVCLSNSLWCCLCVCQTVRGTVCVSVKQSGVLFVCLSNSLGCCLCVCQTVWVLSVCQQLGLILIYSRTHKTWKRRTAVRLK